MANKKILFISLATIFIVIIFHFFALQNSWYWRVRWIDIPVHIIGGFGVALLSVWIALKFKHINNICNYKIKSFLIIFVSVLSVGIFWEIFELIIRFTHFGRANYWEESLVDVINGLIGGVIAYFYFIKYKKTKCYLALKDKKKHFCENLLVKDNQ